MDDVENTTQKIDNGYISKFSYKNNLVNAIFAKQFGIDTPAGFSKDKSMPFFVIDNNDQNNGKSFHFAHQNEFCNNLRTLILLFDESDGEDKSKVYAFNPNDGKYYNYTIDVKINASYYNTLSIVNACNMSTESNFYVTSAEDMKKKEEILTRLKNKQYKK